MKRKYKISLITVFATILAAVLIAVCVLTSRSAAVFASDRYVTMDGSNIFYTTIRGAEVTSAKETVTIPSVEEGGESKEEDQYFTLFKIGDKEEITYRKSLAYSWKSGVFDADENPTGEYSSHYFSMVIGFESVNFSKFIIKFQSQQYLKTEDNITENYLVFIPGENDSVDIAAVQTLDDEIKEEQYTASASTMKNARIEIAFCDYEGGTVSISINGVPTDLRFKNVYFPYASYVSSGDSAVTPLTFTAQFEEGALPAEGEDELTADMKLYELNGQSFRLYAHDSDGVYNDVRDDMPPVICFTQTPSYVEFGKTINFSYQVIDVLATSPRATANFYVLTGKQYAADDYNYMQLKYEDQGSNEEEKDEEVDELLKNPFIKVSSGSDIRVIRDSKTFVPNQYLETDDGYNVYGLIKVYYELTDVTGSSAKTDKVFVDWYAKETAIVNIYSADYKNVSGVSQSFLNTGNFLKLIDGKDGVTYARPTDSEVPENALEAYKSTILDIREDYQQKLDDAIEELGGRLYAGGDTKFYLPALDGIITDDEYFEIQDYKFSLYYKGTTTGSSTALKYNNLSIPLNDADATYRFTVFITDAFNNPMRYPDVDGEGNLVWKEITTNDIWDEDFADLLPFFEFNVSYKKATAKNPDSLSVAYVGTSYSGVSFDIKDSASTASTHYDLYVFNRNGAYKDIGLNLTYAQFIENFDALFENKYEEGVNTRKYFVTVKPASELKASDANYKQFKAINWNNSTVTFTPQSAEDFYVVRLTLTDKRSQTSDTFFATVAASIQANPVKGESEWLQNNSASIILFVVAGVLLIAFIVLLVIKPKDKGDIDEVYEKGKKSSKKKDKKA